MAEILLKVVLNTKNHQHHVIWKSFTVPNQILEFILYIVKPALRGHLWDNEKMALYGR